MIKENQKYLTQIISQIMNAILNVIIIGLAIVDVFIVLGIVRYYLIQMF